MHPVWVTISRAAERTGYAVEDLQRFISRAEWPQDILWREAPDGTRLVNLERYDLWAAGQLGSLLQRKRLSKSHSPTAPAPAANG